METKNTLQEVVLEAEDYTLVSADTLRNIFPPMLKSEAVEIPLESAPSRSRAERKRLAKLQVKKP